MHLKRQDVKKVALIWFMLATVCGGIASAGTPEADPLEGSLVQAWEQLQKDHPKTTTFERIEPGLYRFVTSRFPFDGQVRVLNVAVDRTSGWSPNEWAMGVVEVELVGLADDFMTKHAHSYSMWAQDNLLYLDPQSQRWISLDDYPSLVNSQLPASRRGCILGQSENIFWLGLLVVVALVLLVVSKKASRQMKSAMAAQDKVLAEQERAMKLTEKAVAISQDSNRLLGEILEAIKDTQKR